MIPTDKIRELIGPGGKVIRGIVEADRREDRRGGQRPGSRLVQRSAAAAKALQMIGDITAVPKSAGRISAR